MAILAPSPRIWTPSQRVSGPPVGLRRCARCAIRARREHIIRRSRWARTFAMAAGGPLAAANADPLLDGVPLVDANGVPMVDDGSEAPCACCGTPVICVCDDAILPSTLIIRIQFEWDDSTGYHYCQYDFTAEHAVPSDTPCLYFFDQINGQSQECDGIPFGGFWYFEPATCSWQGALGGGPVGGGGGIVGNVERPGGSGVYPLAGPATPNPLPPFNLVISWEVF